MRTTLSGRHLMVGAILAALAVFVVVRALDVPEPVRLQAVEPADASTAGAAPTAVSLLFTAAPRPTTIHLVAVGPDGDEVSRGEPVVTGNRVSVRVEASLPGRYQIAYHVVTGEGKAVTGQSAFMVRGDSTAFAAAPAAPLTGADLAGHAHMNRDGGTLALVLLDLVLVAALVLIMVRRPRVR
ncbi:copper resistance CopC family protein [Winogradskya consettensis]|nr:copper resistance CopC family protein [Actinoplanes consettensis]